MEERKKVKELSKEREEGRREKEKKERRKGKRGKRGVREMVDGYTGRFGETIKRGRVRETATEGVQVEGPTPPFFPRSRVPREQPQEEQCSKVQS